MLSQQAPYSGAESAKSYARIYLLYKKGRVTVFTFVLRVCSRHKCNYSTPGHRGSVSTVEPAFSVRIGIAAPPRVLRTR